MLNFASHHDNRKLLKWLSLV